MSHSHWGGMPNQPCADNWTDPLSHILFLKNKYPNLKRVLAVGSLVGLTWLWSGCSPHSWSSQATTKEPWEAKCWKPGPDHQSQSSSSLLLYHVYLYLTLDWVFPPIPGHHRPSSTPPCHTWEAKCRMPGTTTNHRLTCEECGPSWIFYSPTVFHFFPNYLSDYPTSTSLPTF